MDAARELSQRGAAVVGPAFSSTRAVAAVIGVAAALLVGLAPSPGTRGAVEAGPCPNGMVSIKDDFCIDQFEARLVEIDRPRRGKKKPEIVGSHSPFEPVGDKPVMAVVEKGRVPQGYISKVQAEEACLNAGKRLCTDEEWVTACKGKNPTLYPYGDEHEEGRCNDKGLSSFNMLFGPGNNEPPDQSAYTRENMNDPRLNKMKGTVAKSGSFSRCKSSFKVFDMVGNLHEWTSDPKGTFRGGFYLDTKINGEGCEYKTGAHDVRYHDYSTGFRCCFGGEEQKKAEKIVAERGEKEKRKKKEGAKAGEKKKKKKERKKET